jgi:serine/threonine protein kinase/tetratricopeptide (TPR) repeat protein
MDSANWKKVKAVFSDAADLPKDQLSLFLDNYPAEIRSEVEKMLRAIETEENLLNEPIVELSQVWENEDLLGQKIGDYKILREVGEGGMGSVYEARRDDGEFEQRVAIKLIKSGLGSKEISSRFRHERRILASLEHPNIARLLGGGLTPKGLPYYVMEFIEGLPIDEYCSQNSLSVTERLELFQQVCAAVSFAHSKLVVHRDLKPSNIFVTRDGIVKLLDFGISKVLTPEANEMGTATQMGMMTPAYASPEQVRGETVSTSTDVYSLGVILYQLLTETLPYQTKGKSLAELLELVSAARIERPSTVVEHQPNSKLQLVKLIRGDLDIIALKALNRDIARRYHSVEQLSADIRRYLTGLPISARPDSVAYRYSKFIHRNRISVVAVSAVFLALVGGIVATLYQNRVARQQQAIAEKRFEQVRKLANNVVFKYHDAIANLPGSTEAREMLVTDATEYLDNLAQDAGDNPDLLFDLAGAYIKIGNVQGAAYLANLGDSDGSLQSYEKSVGILEELVRRYPEKIEYLVGVNDALEQKNLLLVRLGRWQEAELSSQKNIEINLELIRKQAGNLDPQKKLIKNYQILGDAVNFRHGHLASVELYRKGLQEAERVYREHPHDEMIRRNLIVSLQRIGTKSEYHAEILKETNEPKDEIAAIFVEAEQYHRRTMELAQELRRDFPNNEMYARYISAIQINWGTALARIGRGSDGVPLIRQSCQEFRQTVVTDPKNYEAKRDVAECLQYLAFAYDAMNKPDEAVRANEESLRILEEITVQDPKNFEFLSQAHLTFNNTGDIFLRQRKLADALDFYQQGMRYVDRMSALNQTSHNDLLRSESNRKIGEAYLAMALRDKSAEHRLRARSFLEKAKQTLVDLQSKNELGKNNEHKLELIENELRQLSS